jgi:hypothetical protein
MRDLHTDLYVHFTNGELMCFPRVHPDNRYIVSEGLLTFEDEDGGKIHYLPVTNIRNFFTECCEGCAY